MLGKERALCHVYTQRAKVGLRLRLKPLLTDSDSTRHLSDNKEGSAMFMSTEPCNTLLMSLVFFERTAERLQDFWMWCQEQQARRQLCARGGGSAPRIKDGWRRKENSESKEGSRVIGVCQCL